MSDEHDTLDEIENELETLQVRQRSLIDALIRERDHLADERDTILAQQDPLAPAFMELTGQYAIAVGDRERYLRALKRIARISVRGTAIGDIAHDAVKP